MTKVSIISPVYNNALFLNEALSGMISQTYKNLEIILVNDGSTDNSLEIMNDFAEKDNRIVILNKENSGAGDSRNQGLKLATGDYVIFLDSDDIFYPNMIEESLSKAIKDKSDIVFFNYYEKDNIKGSKTEKTFMTKHLEKDNVSILSNRDLKKYTLGITSQTPWNKLYKKSFLIKNQLTFSNLSSNNDVSFISNAFLIAEKISYTSNFLLEYRINTRTSISSNRSKKVYNILSAIKEVEDFLIERNLLKEFKDVYYIFAISSILVNIKNADHSIKEDFYNQCKKFLSRPIISDIVNNLDRSIPTNDYHKITNYSFKKFYTLYKLKILFEIRFKNNKVTYRLLRLPIMQKICKNNTTTYKLLGIKVLTKN